MHKSKNSNEEKDRSLNLNIHSNRVHGKRVLFSSRVESSFPSKVRQFHSHQINHIRHKGGSEDWKRLYLFKAGRSTLFVHYQGLQRVRKTKYRPDNHIPKICQWENDGLIIIFPILITSHKSGYQWTPPLSSPIF